MKNAFKKVWGKMERQLFDWKEWDEQGMGSLYFEGVTLKVPVGKFDEGAYFDFAYVDYDKGHLQLGNHLGLDHDGKPLMETHDFALKLSVVEHV